MTTALSTFGIVFPASMLSQPWFAVLSAFVAINTVLYTALAIAKILPKVYLGDFWHRRDRRLVNRSIHPNAEEQHSP